MSYLTANTLKDLYEASKADTLKEMRGQTFYIQISGLKEMAKNKFALRAKISDGYFCCTAVFTEKAINGMPVKIEENDILQISGNVQVQTKDESTDIIVAVKDQPIVYKKDVKRILGNPETFNNQDYLHHDEPMLIPGEAPPSNSRKPRKSGGLTYEKNPYE